MPEENSELTTLALERAPMVRILQEELDRFVLSRVNDLMDLADRRGPDLCRVFDELSSGAGLNVACALERPGKAVLTPVGFYLRASQRTGTGGKTPKRNVYVDTKLRPGDERGLVCELTTFFASTGRPPGLSASQLHNRLGDHEGFEPPGTPHPKGTSGQQLWQSEVHLVQHADGHELEREFERHLDSLPVALFEWERLCREVEERGV